MESSENQVRVMVFFDENEEVQVGLPRGLHPRAARFMLEIAAKKLELMEFGMMLEQQSKPDIAIARAVPRIG